MLLSCLHLAGSLRLDADILHQLRPFGALGADVFGIFVMGERGDLYSLLGEVQGFSGGLPAEDDQTLIVAKAH